MEAAKRSRVWCAVALWGPSFAAPALGPSALRRDHHRTSSHPTQQHAHTPFHTTACTPIPHHPTMHAHLAVLELFSADDGRIPESSGGGSNSQARLQQHPGKIAFPGSFNFITSHLLLRITYLIPIITHQNGTLMHSLTAQQCSLGRPVARALPGCRFVVPSQPHPQQQKTITTTIAPLPPPTQQEQPSCVPRGAYLAAPLPPVGLSLRVTMNTCLLALTLSAAAGDNRRGPHYARLTAAHLKRRHKAEHKDPALTLSAAAGGRRSRCHVAEAAAATVATMH